MDFAHWVGGHGTVFSGVIGWSSVAMYSTFSLFLGFLSPVPLVREQAFLGLFWCDRIGISRLSTSPIPHISSVGILGKQTNKNKRNPSPQANKQTPQDTHHHVILQIPRSLSILLPSFHPSQFSYICFMYNIQGHYLYLQEGIEKLYVLHLSRSRNPEKHFKKMIIIYLNYLIMIA